MRRLIDKNCKSVILSEFGKKHLKYNPTTSECSYDFGSNFYYSLCIVIDKECIFNSDSDKNKFILITGGRWCNVDIIHAEDIHHSIILRDSHLSGQITLFDGITLDNISYDSKNHQNYSEGYNLSKKSKSKWLSVSTLTGAVTLNSCSFEGCDVSIFTTHFLKIESCRFSICSVELSSAHVVFLDKGALFEYSDLLLNITGSIHVGKINNITLRRGTIHFGDWINLLDDKSVINFQSADEIIDPWADLRDEYTGKRLYLILFTTLIFFLPYLTKTWFLLNADTLEKAGLFNYYVETKPLYELLFWGQFEGPWKYWMHTAFLLTGIALVGYNIARMYLTLQVNRHREREEHLQELKFQHSRPSQKNLVARFGIDTSKWWVVKHIPKLNKIKFGRTFELYKIHEKVKLLGWLALGSGLAKIIFALFQDVPAIIQ